MKRRSFFSVLGAFAAAPLAWIKPREPRFVQYVVMNTMTNNGPKVEMDWFYWDEHGKRIDKKDV